MVQCKGGRELGRNLTNVRKIVNFPGLPPLRVCRDPCKVEGFQPHFLAIVFTYLGQFIRQPELSLLPPLLVGC